MPRLGSEFVTSISKAKTSLPQLVEKRQPTVLMRHNQPVGAVLSIDAYNEYVSLQQLSRRPALLARLMDAAKKARRAPLTELATLEDFERRTASSR